MGTLCSTLTPRVVSLLGEQKLHGSLIKILHSSSWGEDTDTNPYLEQYVAAWLKAGTVPVWAVGNSGPKCHTSVSPADYSGAIGVGGTDKRDGLLEFSSRGPASNASNGPLPYNPLTPSIVAPGLGIRGPTEEGNGYAGLSGTSQACPHVAGAAALLLSVDSKLNPARIAEILHRTAATRTLTDPGDGDSCGGENWDTFPNFMYGWGRLDCFAAVQLAKKSL